MLLNELKRWFFVASIFLIGTSCAAAQATKPAREIPRKWTTAEICSQIEKSAEQWKLSKHFFARLIWKESRFDIRAVSPVGAQGIAQFMPATAKARGLKDPYDPAQAIPASASLLSFHRGQFGNLGLAAAAYNAGPGRVQRWLNGRSSLPFETEDYVEDLSTIGSYDSDGCIRLTQSDIEELYAIVITKPTVVEIVADFHDAEVAKEIK